MPDAHKNFSYSTVATAPSPASSGTSLVVASGDGAKFPTVPFNATVWPTASQPTTANAEIVRVTAISTDTLTITRAQESSSARTVVVGDQIAATVTAKTLTDIEAIHVSTDTIFDAKGDLAVGTGADASSALTVGANGTQPYADTNASTGIRWATPNVLGSPFRPAGAKIETFPRSLSNNADTAATITTAVLSLHALPEVLRAGVTYTSISFVSAAGALSVGSNQWFTLVGLTAGPTLTTLRSTTDDTSTAWAANTVKTLNLSSTYTPTTDITAYVGIMVKATTPPTMKQRNLQSSIPGLAPIICGASSTGQAGPLSDGTPLTAITAGTNLLWAYVS